MTVQKTSRNLYNVLSLSPFEDREVVGFGSFLSRDALLGRPSWFMIAVHSHCLSFRTRRISPTLNFTLSRLVMAGFSGTSRPNWR